MLYGLRKGGYTGGFNVIYIQLINCYYIKLQAGYVEGSSGCMQPVGCRNNMQVDINEMLS